MYKYWRPVVSEKHYLYAKEIAEYWGLYSVNQNKDNLHVKLAYYLLETIEYMQRENPLYFNSRSGMMRCFNPELVAKAFHRLSTYSHEEPQYNMYDDGNRKFKYRFLERSVQDE